MSVKMLRHYHQIGLLEPVEVDRGHVAQHAIPVDGPIREFYLVGPQDRPDETAWRTEIGWPVLHTIADT
jgi:hypothetical protein